MGKRVLRETRASSLPSGSEGSEGMASFLFLLMTSASFGKTRVSFLKQVRLSEGTRSAYYRKSPEVKLPEGSRQR